MNSDNHPPRILAADPSQHAGLAVLEDFSPRPIVHTALQVDLPKQGTLTERCHVLSQTVDRLHADWGPFAAVFVEHAEHQWQHASNTDVERALGAYTIAIGLTAKQYQCDVPVVEIDPQEWHRSMIGAGLKSEAYKAASLAQVKLRAFRGDILSGIGDLLPFETKSDNISDAVMVGIYGLGIMRTGLETYLKAREAIRLAGKERKRLERQARETQGQLYRQYWPHRRIR